VERIWEAALAAGIDRGSGLVGVGGGVVGDLAGFAAATLLRGVAVGHVPTSLLAMVDSAIGGKTGFDTAHGKNLVGAFHQPSFVLCDTDVLATLPELERRAGLAEVVKSAWIEGEAAVAQLERDRDALGAGEPEATRRAIRMSAALKARIVTEDERESGARALLNLGHTVGHAIEAAEGYRGMRHGQAVALGMMAAFELSVRVGHAGADEVERLRRLLEGLGLPTRVHPYMEPRVLSFIGSDKKRRSDHITFVLPGKPGDVQLQRFALDRLMELLAAS
jgi:3-dehydroquinate synthase